MITKEMTIEEIFTSFPQKSQRLAQEMTNLGLSCVGCGAAVWETLEGGMKGHGFDDAAVSKLLDKLNAILEEAIDTGTVQMTEAAAAKFKAVASSDGKEGWSLLLDLKKGGCSGFEYNLDFVEKPREGDKVFSSHGVNILVAEAHLDRLLGCVIDYVDGLNGAGFKISNPNVKKSCHCGSSQGY